MSKYSRSIYGILASAGFYGLFGVLFPEYFLEDALTREPYTALANRTVSSVVKNTAIAISLVLAIWSFVQFVKARRK